MSRLFLFVRRWWGKGLRRKLLVPQFANAFVALLLFGVIAISIGQNTVRREVNLRNSELAALLASDIDQDFTNIWMNVRLFTSELYTTNETLTLQAHAMLNLRRVAPTTYRALYLFDSQGNLSISLADPLEELLKVTDVNAILNRPAAELPREVEIALAAAMQGETYISPVIIKSEDRLPVLYMGFRIGPDLDAGSQVMVAEIDLQEIWGRLDGISVDETGRAYLVSREGVIIAHPDHSQMGQLVDANLAPLLNGKEGSIEYRDQQDGKVLLASFSPVESIPGWHLVVEQELGEVIAPINQLYYSTAAFLLLIVLLTLVGGEVISRILVRPIKKLVRATETVASNHDLSQDIQVEGEDEVAKLAQAFNAMIASLRENQVVIQQHTDTLEKAVKGRTDELLDAQELLVRHASDLEFANKEMEAFSYSIAHDLRAPLRALNGYSQLLLEEYEDRLEDDGKDYLERIRKSSLQMTVLIDNLLKLSRMGRQEIVRQDVNLEELLRNVILELEPETHQRNIQWQIGGLPMVTGDRALLRVVLVNLLSNALKYTRSRLQAQIEIGSQEDVSMGTVIYVRDNGIGFDMKYQDRLFGVFQRLHSSEEFEGTGIGLATVRRIINRHGGKTWAEGKVEGGATFYFSLPHPSDAS
jgi:signal transduction histidine kinase